MRATSSITQKHKNPSRVPPGFIRQNVPIRIEAYGFLAIHAKRGGTSVPKLMAKLAEDLAEEVRATLLAAA